MIKNLIIDFGGVLYQIAPTRTLDLLNSYGAIKHTYNELANMQVFRDYETDSISSQGFIASIRDLFAIPMSISDVQIIEAWNSTLVGLFENIISTVRELKSRFNIVLLSNTNELHYDCFLPDCQELFSIFDRCFFSHHIKMRKPDTYIYEYVINEMRYKSKETIFIDDSMQNLEGAKKAGLAIYAVTPDTSVSDFLHTV